MQNNIKYNNLKDIFSTYLSLSTLGTDFSTRLALVSLICYLYNNLKTKIPDITYWTLVYKLGKGMIPEEMLKGLSILCEEFGTNCKEFPTFGIEDKKIPARVKEILSNWLPF